MFNWNEWIAKEYILFLLFFYVLKPNMSLFMMISYNNLTKNVGNKKHETSWEGYCSYYFERYLFFFYYASMIDQVVQYT